MGPLLLAQGLGSPAPPHTPGTRVSPPASKPLTPASSCVLTPFWARAPPWRLSPQPFWELSGPSHLEDDDEGQPGGQDGPEVLGDVVLVFRPWWLPIVLVPAKGRRVFRRSWGPGPLPGSCQESLGRLQGSPSPAGSHSVGGFSPHGRGSWCPCGPGRPEGVSP